MKTYKEILTEETEDGFQYATALKGGSIGERNIRSAADLKGLPIKDYVTVKDTREEAAESAKRSNKNLSAGEKKYYGLRWIVVQVKDGKYTGK